MSGREGLSRYVNWEGNFTHEPLHQLLCAKSHSFVPVTDHVCFLKHSVKQLE